MNSYSDFKDDVRKAITAIMWIIVIGLFAPLMAAAAITGMESVETYPNNHPFALFVAIITIQWQWAMMLFSFIRGDDDSDVKDLWQAILAGNLMLALLVVLLFWLHGLYFFHGIVHAIAFLAYYVLPVPLVIGWLLWGKYFVNRGAVHYLVIHYFGAVVVFGLYLLLTMRA